MEGNSDEIHRVLKRGEDCQTGDNEFVVLKDSSIFRMGERFDSYDELLKRLASHSKQSSVHYWRRDSRTVQGAYMKTARPIESKLVYYSVKYACVYGGQKFFPRGKGQRHSITMRTDCPSHIMVRASKSGRQLEVISVCNAHNHPVSKDLYKKLPQDRRLSPEVKQEVLDLLRLGVERKCVRDYVKEQTGKILTNKDLLNLGAGDRRLPTALKPERAISLIKAITDFESNEDAMEKQDLGLAESTDSQESSADMDLDSPPNKGRWERAGDTVLCQVAEEDILVQDSDGVYEGLDCTLHESMNDPIGREVEIFYEEEPRNAKNIIEYLYPSIVDSYSTKIDNLPSSNDIVIENIGLIDTEELTAKNNTAKDFSNALEIIDDESFAQTENCLSETLEDENTNPKVKFKFVNIDSIFIKSESNKVLIQQNTDSNENMLFQNITGATNDGVADSEVDLRNILVVRDSLTGGDMCNLPIQMLKLGSNGTVELKNSNEINEYITLQDDRGILTFADNDQNIIVQNSLSDQEIAALNSDDKITTPFSFASKQSVCDSCGKTGAEISKHLIKLRKEKDALEREIKNLRTKRTKLKSDISYSKRLARAEVQRNANIKKALQSLTECDELDTNQIECVYIPE